MSALLKLIRFIFAAGVMPVLTGLLPVSFLPQERRRVPWLILAGYLTTFALFELIGIPILLFTTYGDFRLLVYLFTAADLIVIALGLLRCLRSGGIRLPYGLEARIAFYHRRMREESSGKRYDQGSGTLSGRANRTASGVRGRASGLFGRRRAGRAGKDAEHYKFDPDALLFWIIFVILLLFELYMAYTTASFDGDDAYYVAQSVQTWQTGTMYYYVPYTGWTTTLDGRHALAMVPIWIAYIATMCGTHPTIVTHSLLPMILIPLVDVCMYCAASQLLASQPQEKQRRMLPALMILVAVLQIFGNVSIYTPETFLIMRTWQGKSLLANLILPAAFALLLRWCSEHHVGEEAQLQSVRRKVKRAEKELAGKEPGTGKGGACVVQPDATARVTADGDALKEGACGTQADAAKEPAAPGRAREESGGESMPIRDAEAAPGRMAEPVREAAISGQKHPRGESIFFWIMVIGLNLASGFCTALAPAILALLLIGAAFLIAVFLKKGRFLLSMLFACIPNCLYLILLLRTMNSQWFSFLQGGRLP